MDPFLASAAISIGGSILGSRSARKQRRAQREAARKLYEAKDELNKYQTALEIRKQQRSAMEARRASAREEIILASQQAAQAHASGLSGSGLAGAQQYLAAQAGRNQANINFNLDENLDHLEQMQVHNDRLAAAGADMEKANTMSPGYGSLLTTIGGMGMQLFGGYRPSSPQQGSVNVPTAGSGGIDLNLTPNMFNHSGRSLFDY